MLFLPQKTYLPLDSTLKQVCCYPVKANDYTDAQVQDTLRLCQLPHLCGRLADLCDWSQTLSIGEQQRVGFIRALLQNPEFLFLDEATSALDNATESKLYALLKSKCPNTCVVSVGHRDALRQWHNETLRCQEYKPQQDAPDESPEPMGFFSLINFPSDFTNVVAALPLPNPIT